MLARRATALAALTALLQGSCLVTSVDEFPEPTISPPFLNGSRATPPLAQVILIDPTTPTTVQFSAYVRSEDAGSELEARWVADWPSTESVIQISQVGSGTFSEERLITLSWDPNSPTLIGQPLSPGCHPITLVVSHRFSTLLNIPARLEDSDFLVWWVFLGDPADPDSLASFDVSTCPTPQKLPPVEASP